jgi:hypothetical protein
MLRWRKGMPERPLGVWLVPLLGFLLLVLLLDCWAFGFACVCSGDY